MIKLDLVMTLTHQMRLSVSNTVMYIKAECISYSLVAIIIVLQSFLDAARVSVELTARGIIDVISAPSSSWLLRQSLLTSQVPN